MTTLLPLAIAGAALAAPAMPAPAVPDVAITMTGPDNLAALEPGVWNITVTNTGTVPVNAADIMVDMPLFGWYGIRPMREPAGGVLEPGASIIYRETARFGTEICGKKKDITVSAEVYLKTGADANVENDMAETVSWAEGCMPDLAIEKSANGSEFAPGDEVRWTLTVTNRGNTWIPVSKIIVSDPMAGATTLIDPPADGYLSPNASVHYEAATSTEACGTLTNTASVRLADDYGAVDYRPDNDSASQSVEVNRGTCAPTPPVTPPTTIPTPPAPEVVPTSTPKPTICARTTLQTRVLASKRSWAGSTTGVRILVRNRGANSARGVKVRYALPVGASLVKRPRGATLRGRVVTVPVAAIARSHQRGVSLRIRWSRQAAGARRHVARATATCTNARAGATVTRVRPLQGAVLPAVTG
ncbi:MAG: hypothetical protein R2878_08445 [Thermoleophilia bacterium]